MATSISSNAVDETLHPVLVHLETKRRILGKSYKTLEEMTGHSNSAICNALRGIRNPGFALLVDVAEVFGYEIVLAPKPSHAHT